MVKKKPQDKIQLVEYITDNETKIKSNEEKEDKQSLDNELISHITNSIDLINSKITELNAKYNNLTEQANKITKWVLGVVFLGFIGIVATFIIAIYNIPNEFIVKNKLSKEDIKEIIQYTYQQQVIKHK